MQIVNDLETNLTTKLRSDPDPGGVIVELCHCLESETNYKTIVQSIRRELCKCTQQLVRNKLVISHVHVPHEPVSVYIAIGVWVVNVHV